MWCSSRQGTDAGRPTYILFFFFCKITDAAITVHKSQGSEFPAVILPLLDGANVLYTRNLLYTAVTRAKALLIIVGTKERISQMVGNNITDRRYSGLKYRIAEMMAEE